MSERFDNYIGGSWIAGQRYRQNINPSETSDVIGEYAQADAEQVQAALSAAREAFPAWSLSGVQQRFDALDFVGSELLARKQEIGRLLAREEGKTVPEGIAEVTRAGQIFKFFAGEALRTGGEYLPSVRPGVRSEVTREPLGVVGLICPWNFPIAIPAWKIAPALAYGNCVVFKPAELVPGCAWALTEILSRAKLPAGVFNLVNGPGRVVGEVMLQSGELDAVSFTGSLQVGARIREQAAAQGIKVQLEMGGKNPLVILEDADMEVAVECAVQGAYYSSGQRCTASSRLIVTRSAHDRFIEAMQARMQRVRIGNALEEGTDIGPLASADQLDTVRRYAAIAREEGGTMIEAGAMPADASRGYYHPLGLVIGTDKSMTINREEVFGPIASVLQAADYDEALALANDSPFGLSAGVCTRSLKYAEHFKRHSEAGMVMVNLPTAGVDYHVPFGGRKRSSYGPREQGAYAREFYTTVKTAYVRWQ